MLVKAAAEEYVWEWESKLLEHLKERRREVFLKKLILAWLAERLNGRGDRNEEEEDRDMAIADVQLQLFSTTQQFSTPSQSKTKMNLREIGPVLSVVTHFQPIVSQPTISKSTP